MKKLNQKGFGIVEVLLLIVIVGLLGVVGWLTYSRMNKNDSNSATVSESSDVEETTTASGKTLEITELGIKVNDPENRGLRYEKVTLTDADGQQSQAYMIRDNNDVYFNECEYPASISQLTDQQYENGGYSNPNDYYYNLVKKVNGKWYIVGTGTNFQSACKYDETTQDSAYKEYEDGLRQYIANNLSAL